MLMGALWMGTAPPAEPAKHGRHPTGSGAHSPTAISRSAPIPDAPLSSGELQAGLELQSAARAGRWADVLLQLRAMESSDPDFYRTNSCEYLRGRAAAALGKNDEALGAYDRLSPTKSPLALLAGNQAAWLRFRMGEPAALDALARMAHGTGDEAERAARQLVTYWAGRDAGKLLETAVDLERRGPSDLRRDMRFERAEALLALSRTDEGAAILLDLAAGPPEPITSYSALLELERIGKGLAVDHPAATLRRLAETALHHRDFDRAIPALERNLPPGVDREFRLAHACEQAERYPEAEAHYRTAIAAGRPGPALDLHQYRLSQTLVLAGRGADAAVVLEKMIETTASPSANERAKISLLRLEVELGRLDDAVALLHQLAGWSAKSDRAQGGKRQTRKRRGRPVFDSSSPSTIEDAGILVASSLLMSEKKEAAAALLEEGAPDSAASPLLLYWRGRLSESSGRPLEAAARFALLSARAGDDPIGASARERLAALPAAARQQVRKELIAGLLGGGDAGVETALATGRKILALSVGAVEQEEALSLVRASANRSARLAPFLALEPAPIPRPLPPGHPGALKDPTRQLLALGLFDEAGADLQRYLPLGRPGTALAAALAYTDGADWPRALYAAEILRNGAADLPFEALPLRIARILFPEAYPAEVAAGSLASGVEPELIRAVIREESRFRPASRSGASARGLMQFVIPTAQDVSRQLGLGEIRPDDLYRPDLSITLGARYLANLLKAFSGDRASAIAAYNAGVPAARSWRSFAGSGDLDRYLAAVTYPETKTYVRRVFGSYLRYRELRDRPLSRSTAAGS